MEIRFNTDTLTVREATGLLALLTTACPDVLNAAAETLGARGLLEMPEGVAVSGPSAGAQLADAAAAFGAGEPGPAPADPAAAFAAPAAPMPATMPAEAGAPFADGATAPDGSTATPTLAPAAAPASPSSPTTSGGSVELDAAGLPWDARIHAKAEKGPGGTKNKSDGKWRAKRGVSADEVAKVTAELRAQYPEPAAAPAPAAAAPAPPPPPPADVAPAAPPPPPPPAAAAPAASEGAAPSPAQEFARVMRRVTEAQTAGKLDANTVAGIVTASGLAKLPDLIANPALIPTFEALLDTHLATVA